MGHADVPIRDGAATPTPVPTPSPTPPLTTPEEEVLEAPGPPMETAHGLAEPTEKVAPAGTEEDRQPEGQEAEETSR